MINKISLFLILTLVSCGSSDVMLSPEMCASTGTWAIDYSKVEQQQLVKQRGLGFYITKKVWTPLGLFKTHTVYLRDLLKLGDIECNDVYNLDYTIYSDWKDALRSFVPFMGSKTVSISGTIDPITKTREYRELIRDSKIIIYDE